MDGWLVLYKDKTGKSCEMKKLLFLGGLICGTHTLTFYLLLLLIFIIFFSSSETNTDPYTANNNNHFKVTSSVSHTHCHTQKHTSRVKVCFHGGGKWKKENVYGWKWKDDEENRNFRSYTQIFLYTKWC